MQKHNRARGAGVGDDGDEDSEEEEPPETDDDETVLDHKKPPKKGKSTAEVSASIVEEIVVGSGDKSGTKTEVGKDKNGVTVVTTKTTESNKVVIPDWRRISNIKLWCQGLHEACDRCMGVNLTSIVKSVIVVYDKSR